MTSVKLSILLYCISFAGILPLNAKKKMSDLQFILVCLQMSIPIANTLILIYEIANKLITGK